MNSWQPERIGKYTITRKIGEGAMGVVYEAFDPDIKRALAIKTIRRELIDSDQGVAAAAARFRNEAQAAGRLLHPGIAAVYEYGETEHYAYIAMEYVPGNSLREFLGRGVRLGEQDLLSVMTQLLEALQYAHEHGVWHRDIKPANLIVTRAGKVKIADFGIARIENAGLTVDGALIGTPGYMAPEQFADVEIDHRIDLYASGAVLYQLLTGQQVYSGSMEQVMYKTVTETPLPPSQVEGAGHWARYDPVVLRALARDRDQRYGSAREFQDALLAVGGQPASATVSDATLVMVPQAAAPEPGAARPAAPRHHDAAAPKPAPVPVRAPVQAPLPAAASRPATVSAGAGDTMPSGWDARTLAEVESSLVRHVGPMAKILVRRAATQTADLQRLRQLLAEHLPEGEMRDRFVRGAGGNGDTSAAAATRVVDQTVVDGTSRPGEQGTPDDGAARALVTPDLLERATAVLSTRLGPIARLLVRKAAAGAGDRAAFCTALVDQVADADEARALARDLERICREG
ncbi:MAG: serine/threonine protein kinase [Burkholderiales bacterium]|nr:MAG: serine/threonine protein kinase [Burkholderiales bacterium]